MEIDVKILLKLLLNQLDSQVYKKLKETGQTKSDEIAKLLNEKQKHF